MDEVLPVLEKAVLQGSLTGLGTYTMVAGSGAVIVTPAGEYPAWMVGSALGVVNSLGNDLLHKFVWREVPVNKKFRHELSLVMGVVSGALMYNFGLGVLHADLPQEHGVWKGLAIGGGSELAASLILDAVK